MLLGAKRSDRFVRYFGDNKEKMWPVIHICSLLTEAKVLLSVPRDALLTCAIQVTFDQTWTLVDSTNFWEMLTAWELLQYTQSTLFSIQIFLEITRQTILEISLWISPSMQIIPTQSPSQTKPRYWHHSTTSSQPFWTSSGSNWCQKHQLMKCNHRSFTYPYSFAYSSRSVLLSRNQWGREGFHHTNVPTKSVAIAEQSYPVAENTTKRELLRGLWCWRIANYLWWVKLLLNYLK